MRNLLRWGMDQLEIFYEKGIFFQKYIPYKALGMSQIAHEN